MENEEMVIDQPAHKEVKWLDQDCLQPRQRCCQKECHVVSTAVWRSLGQQRISYTPVQESGECINGKDPGWALQVFHWKLILTINQAGQWLAPLQALVVLDFKLTIDNRTAADVQLGRRGEAVSSTTRNQSSSQLQMGPNQKNVNYKTRPKY